MDLQGISNKTAELQKVSYDLLEVHPCQAEGHLQGRDLMNPRELVSFLSPTQSTCPKRAI